MEGWAPFAEGKSDLFHNEVLARIGEKHGKSVARLSFAGFSREALYVSPKCEKRADGAELRRV